MNQIKSPVLGWCRGRGFIMKKKLRYYLPKKYKYPKIAEICWIKLAENSIDYFGGAEYNLIIRQSQDILDKE
jgi:hypothetical protein